MARTREGLQQAVETILTQNGERGKRLSLRQAERRTGLSPATIGELAKGNARTPETIRRFAQGFGEDEQRLLLLAGFVPEDMVPPLYTPSGVGNGSAALSVSLRRNEHAAKSSQLDDAEPDDREWLGRFGRALAQMPPGRERDLFKDRLRQDTELIETFLARLTQDADEVKTEGDTEQSSGHHAAARDGGAKSVSDKAGDPSASHNFIGDGKEAGNER